MTAPKDYHITAARKLARIVRNVRLSRLPLNSANEARMRLLDTLGVIIAGSETASAEIIGGLVIRSGGTKESLVLSSGSRAPAPLAALANGTAAHSLNYDDWHALGSVHPGCVVIPTAIALAEKQRASGSELLESIVAGYEAMIRLGMTTLGTALEKGFHTTSICGPFGAAATAAKLLDLSEDQLVNAFGLAGSQSSGLMEFIYSPAWVQRMHAGWAALGGIFSALLAKEGFTGPETVVDGKAGFCKSFSNRADLNPILDAPQDVYEIANVQTKIYASGSETASAADAVLQLVRDRRLRSNEIRKIRLHVNRVAAETLSLPYERKYNPATVVDAQYSLPFTVGAVVIRGKAGLAEFTDESIKDKDILDAAAKVEVALDPELDKLFPAMSPAKVEIITVGDRTYSARTDYPRGSPRNPVGEPEIKAKFRECAGTVFHKDKVRRIEHLLDEIEDIQDISVLMETLT